MSLKTILVIDDEINLRRSLSMILQEAGYQVSTAGSAGEAIQMLKPGAYDLIFLDLKLPDLDGTKVLPVIRQNHPDTPVVILTAHATLSSAIEAVRQGARDYLLKPIKPDQLLKRVEQILAEQVQPKRRRELVSQIQGLLSELRESDSVISQESVKEFPNVFDDTNRLIRNGPFCLDLHTKTVTLKDQLVKLPPSTFDYLVTLIRHAPNPVGYEELVLESQGYTVTKSEAREMARWQIHEMRKVIEVNTNEPQYIQTVRNVGYRIVT